MKTKALLVAAATAVVVALSFGITVQAAGTSDLTVAYTSSENMEYTAGSLDGVFSGMAPGDEKTATIEIQNNSGHAANISISQETVKALEDANTASGGAYTYDLSYVDAEGNKVSLMTTVAGGYSGDTASKNGLKDIDELKDYTMISRLENGGKTYVYLTLGMDGEGIKNGYKNTAGQMDLKFMASYVDPDTGKVVYTTTTETRKGGTRYVDRVVRTLAPMTGDNPLLFVGIAIMGFGLVCILLGMRKQRKAGDK